jgi:hypothetical protein
MATTAPADLAGAKVAVHSKIHRAPSRAATIVFGALLSLGVLYSGTQLVRDVADVHSPSILPFVLLGIALFIALGFEFVNGFHDTANAVATVIYTHSLEPQAAVVWSGMWNFIGVLVSTGTVAFGIISLLPVELILQVGGGAGFAMVFALLVAAILWNLGTWYFGLPSSSSHTLIGSIIGVGLANQLMAPKSGTSGVDWGQAANIGKSLLIEENVHLQDARQERARDRQPSRTRVLDSRPGRCTIDGLRRGRGSPADRKRPRHQLPEVTLRSPAIEPLDLRAEAQRPGVRGEQAVECKPSLPGGEVVGARRLDALVRRTQVA